MRLRDVGLLSLDDDRELEELLRALQGTMVYDKRTLVEASPPASELKEDPPDEELRIAYADIDYEALRSSARLRQYADALGSAGNRALGPIPSDIQLALRSITDAFSEIVGRTSPESRRVTFSNEWTPEDEDRAAEIDDPALLQEDPEETALDGQEEVSPDLESLEEASERRWSEAARLRVHWRNFIDRYLRGLESPAWQEIVGTAVLSGNYEVFSHILQKLHRQPWQNFEFMEFLVRAQAKTHGFVWGPWRGGSAGSGWLLGLPPRDRDLVLRAFSERHLPVRLVVDLAGCGTLTHPGEFEDSDWLLNERKLMRDTARAVLTHPYWPELLSGEEDFASGATAVAADLASPGDFSYWLEPPSFGQLLDDIEELVAFATTRELQRDIALLVGVDPVEVRVDEILLGPEGRQATTQDLEIEGLPRLDLDSALAAMARFVIFHQGPRYRVHAGRVRLLYDRERGVLEWVPSLYEDTVTLPALPAVEFPWDEGLGRLRALAPEEGAEAVA